MNVNLNVSTNDYLQQYNKQKIEELNRTPQKDVGTVEQKPQELRKDQTVNTISQDQKPENNNEYDDFKREEVQKRTKEYAERTYQERMGTRVDITI